MDCRYVVLMFVAAMLLISGCASLGNGTAAPNSGVPGVSPSAPPQSGANVAGNQSVQQNAAPSDYVNKKCTLSQPGKGDIDYYFKDSEHFKTIAKKTDGNVSFTTWFDGNSAYTLPNGMNDGVLVVAKSDVDREAVIQKMLTLSKDPRAKFSCVDYLVGSADLENPSGIIYAKNNSNPQNPSTSGSGNKAPQAQMASPKSFDSLDGFVLSKSEIPAGYVAGKSEYTDSSSLNDPYGLGLISEHYSDFNNADDTKNIIITSQLYPANTSGILLEAAKGTIFLANEDVKTVPRAISYLEEPMTEDGYGYYTIVLETKNAIHRIEVTGIKSATPGEEEKKIAISLAELISRKALIPPAVSEPMPPAPPAAQAPAYAPNESGQAPPSPPDIAKAPLASSEQFSSCVAVGNPVINRTTCNIYCKSIGKSCSDTCPHPKDPNSQFGEILFNSSTCLGSPERNFACSDPFTSFDGVECCCSGPSASASASGSPGFVLNVSKCVFDRVQLSFSYSGGNLPKSMWCDLYIDGKVHRTNSALENGGYLFSDVLQFSSSYPGASHTAFVSCKDTKNIAVIGNSSMAAFECDSNGGAKYSQKLCTIQSPGASDLTYYVKDVYDFKSVTSGKNGPYLFTIVKGGKEYSVDLTNRDGTIRKATPTNAEAYFFNLENSLPGSTVNCINFQVADSDLAIPSGIKFREIS